MPVAPQSNRVLVRHPERPAVLRTPEGALPEIRTPAAHRWWRESRLVNVAVREQLGLEGTVLRCASVDLEPCGGRSATFEIEPARADPAAPAGTRWVEEEPPAARFAALPWEQPRWIAAASDWIGERLAKLNRPRTGPVVQVRNHGYLSCILRAPTGRGAAWFKASPPMHAHETALTAYLAERFPQVVPTVLAADPERAWLLSEEAPGDRLFSLKKSGGPYLPLWKDLLERVARMQIQLGDQLDELRALGVAEWPPQRFAEEMDEAIDRMAESLGAWEEKHGDLAAAPAIQAVRERVPALKDAAAELGESGPPPSLHHGDFHSANILSDGTGTRVIDWAFQAGIAHPFFFLSVVFEEHRDPAARAEVTEAYLAPWRERHDDTSLRRALELAPPLAALHAAFGHQVQLDGARHPWEAVPEARNVVAYLGQAAGAA
ncbi:MAG TPA: phosphotransferase [bacterium]|nr:phosphotransferase [bacterium]